MSRELNTIDREELEAVSSDTRETIPVVDDIIASPPKNLGATTAGFLPSKTFLDTLDDAERLLTFSAECGLEVDGHTCTTILLARAKVGSGWNESIAGNLLRALTKLAKQ